MTPDQSTPEIKTLFESAALYVYKGDEDIVPFSVAIQAVRDTEDRISAEVITDPFAGREDEIRREAVREIVEALREAAHGGNRGQPGSFWVGWRAAARAIEGGWTEKPETDT